MKGFKMKGLPPALRRKKRYVAFKLIVNEKNNNRGNNERLTAKQFFQEVCQKALTLYGEWYFSQIKLELFDEKSGEGILRCTREKLDAVIALLTLLTEVNGLSVAVKTLGVSGTLRGCRRFLKSFKSFNGKEINTER